MTTPRSCGAPAVHSPRLLQGSQHSGPPSPPPRALGVTPQPQRQGDSHQGPRPRGAQGSACPEPRGSPRESARTGCGRLPSFLPAGLFQELVLLCGDPRRVMPRAEWHLPAEGAAELPLAHELPWEQVSETVWIRSCLWLKGWGWGWGWGEARDPKGGWTEGPLPISRHLPLALGQPGGLPGGGFPHSPAHLYSVSVHCWRTGQPSSQGLPVQLFS